MQYSIAAGRYAAVVVSTGAGLRSLTRSGVELTCSYPADALPPASCGATLAPWPNRIRDGRYTFDGVTYQLPITEVSRMTALHGLAEWEPWSAVSVSASSVTLGLDVAPRPGYPFVVRVEVCYSLDDSSGLTVTTVARNTGSVRAPFGAGHHPYLSLRGLPFGWASLVIPAASRLVPDDRLLPIGVAGVEGSAYDLRSGALLGAVDFDDCFTGLAFVDGVTRAALSLPSGPVALWWSDSYPFVQVYLSRELGGVAVEPCSCPPDAFNSGESLVVLEPGESWSGDWGIGLA